MKIKQLILFVLLALVHIQAFAQKQHKTLHTFVYQTPYEVETIMAPEEGKIKNVILMIGDGMSLTHMYTTWVANRGKMWLDNAPITGLSRTYAADRLITDSGAGGTAIATGQKTNYHMVGTDVNGNPLPSLIDFAKEKKLSTGVVVTCQLNDATPADFCCNNPDREQSYEIAADYVTSNADFIFGGGSKYFENRPDGRNIFNEMRKNGYATPRNWNDIQKISSGRVFAVVDSLDLPIASLRGDILENASLKSIEVLSQNPNGFFLMIEGSKIDDYGHSNDISLLVDEIADFDRTIGKVMQWAAQDGETLVIITADHQTGGLTLLNGDIEKGEVVVNFSSNGHTGIMVPVFAFGPGAQEFTGTYENAAIFHKIKKLLNL